MPVSLRTLGLAFSLFLLEATVTAGPVPKAIRRLDGTSITEAALTARIEDLVRKARVHGLAVSIFNGREPVYSRPFGVKRTDTNEPLRTDTVFYGASLSKAVFGALVMRLVEEGVIDLDTPLHKYLDRPVAALKASRPKAWHEDLKALAEDPRRLRITSRMCLSHTTGLPNWRWFEPDRKLRLHFEPGTRYSYSGEGLTFLQVVLERLTRKPLEDLMRERIFIPYRMTASSYTWQPRFEPNFCHGHDEAGRVFEKDKDNAARSTSTLETTPDDYTRFLRAVLNRQGLREPSWKAIFSPQIRIRSKRQFGPLSQEDTTANDAIGLSYGLEGHGDGSEHYSIVFPERGTGVLLMANSANGESAFKELLELTIGDRYTPWKWQDYAPWDGGI